MKTFHNVKCKAYLYDRINTSKGVIRNEEVFLATSEEIKKAFRKQKVIDNKRISIRSVEEIQTFNKPVMIKEIRIE